jgi:hypothetical protein
MRKSWILWLGVSLAASASIIHAEETVWRPVIAQTPTAPPTATNPEPTADTGVSIGRPVKLTGSAVVAQTPVPPTEAARPATVRAQTFDAPPPGATVVPPPPSDPVIIGDPGLSAGPPPGPSFWDKCKDLLNGAGTPVNGCAGRSLFQSDHAFDSFISPVSNPFLFEDPRSLTEVRPIFMYQSAPSKNWVFRGGNAEFFGLQARVALTEQFSIVMNKLGFVGLQPNGNDLTDDFRNRVGFAEIDIGPKFTFLRNDHTGTLGAFGLTFQIPAGDHNVFQDTGSLSLVPYFSFGQSFWHTCYGNFNALGTAGYSFATDDKRSEYLFLSLHLDYDVANLHRIYPLIEMNWFHYTRAGTATNLGFEGEDLVNFGSQGVSGHDFASLAVGARYKFCEWWQVGTTVEWPITGAKDINNFRWTLDMIFRY